MKHKYIKDVVTLKLDFDKCIGCGMCVSVCPHSVFELEEKKAIIKDIDCCMECGACVKNCPVKALSVKKGVGWASAIIKGWLTGSEPKCGC